MSKPLCKNAACGYCSLRREAILQAKNRNLEYKIKHGEDGGLELWVNGTLRGIWLKMQAECIEASLQEEPKQKVTLAEASRAALQNIPLAKLTLKEQAVALYRCMNGVPHTSRRLCQLAGIEYSDAILLILKKLRSAGKIEFQEGKWTRC